MKKILSLILTFLLLTSMLTGCGLLGGRRSAPAAESGGSQSVSSTVSGSWGDQLVRSRNYSYPFGMQEPAKGSYGYTYPFVFSQELRACKGFTLDYQIMEVSYGNLEGNFRYEVLVRTVQGDWKSAGLFQMDGYSATVNVQLDQPRGIDAVAVVCGKQGDEVTYNFTMSVRDPIY